MRPQILKHKLIWFNLTSHSGFGSLSSQHVFFFVKVSNWSFHSSHIRLLAKFISTFMWVDPDSLFLTSLTHQLFIKLALAGPLEGLPVAVVKDLPEWRSHRRHRFSPWVRKSPWRRPWQPTPVFLPGESHEQRSLMGYSPWGHKE